ncbi:MAG: hypothetical protein ACJ79H_04255 [Myxococcales bacterium]
MTLLLQTTQQFTVSVTGTQDTSVTWSVLEGASGGTVSADGLYTAPSAPGTFHVVAASHADASKSASATVVVREPGIRVTVSPASVSLSPRATTDMVAVVTGASDTSVTWSATNGTIDRGIFFAPASEGEIRVIATSRADPTKSATAIVKVAGPVDNGITITPASPSATVSPQTGYLLFSASVHGISDQRVTWSVQEGDGAGYMDQSGYYHAGLVEGTFHVVATSPVNPALTGAAPIRVTWGNPADHGGLVVPEIAATAIWWGKPASFPSELRPAIEEVFGALDGTRYLAVTDQYMRGAKSRVRFDGSLSDDSEPPPSWPTADQVSAKVCEVLDASGLSPGPNRYYMVIAPSFPAGAPPQTCGFHSHGMCHGTTILTAWLPTPANEQSCQWLTSTICDGAARVTQSLVNTAVHEVVEAMTDPLVDAWFNSDFEPGVELADKCSWTYGCLAFGSRQWAIQSIWSNAAHGCVAE